MKNQVLRRGRVMGQVVVSSLGSRLENKRHTHFQGYLVDKKLYPALTAGKGGVFLPAWGKLPLKLKSVKGRNKVGGTHLLPASSCPLLLTRCGWSLSTQLQKGPNKPLWSRYALTPQPL